MGKIVEAIEIEETVARLCREANCKLPADVVSALEAAREREVTSTGRRVLDEILENARLAAEVQAPCCQDTGLAIVFVRIGQDVCVNGGLEEAIQRGIAKGYTEGYLRKSVVRHPFDRKNTGDNTPGFVHVEHCPGSQLELTVLPKGGGSENMGRAKILLPSAGVEGVVEFVVETIRIAGGAPCPPLVVGVGLGGGMEYACLLAKKALLRPVGQPSSDPLLAELEQRALKEINATGIGPMGLGGAVTAMAVHAEATGCHITALPVAVNLGCHALRRATALL